MEEKVEKLLIIDANSVLHRAYHAIPFLKTNKEEKLNAVYGFFSIFLRALKEIKPGFVAITFDLKGPTFRHKEFKEYKAKRVSAPPEFYQQIEVAKKAINVFAVPIFEKKGFEADDIIGTITSLSLEKKKDLEIIILSSDLDTLQLVSSKVKVWTMKKGINEVSLYGEEEVRKRYDGLNPFQMNDMRGLRGDASDNIPGVPGIGEKTAIKLIKEFITLEKLYEALKERGESKESKLVFKENIRKLLERYKEQALFSKKLSEMRKDVPIKFSLEECRLGNLNNKKIIDLLKNLEFYSLINRLPGRGEKAFSEQKRMDFGN